jgi:hypothetical protein
LSLHQDLYKLLNLGELSEWSLLTLFLPSDLNANPPFERFSSLPQLASTSNSFHFMSFSQKFKHLGMESILTPLVADECLELKFIQVLLFFHRGGQALQSFASKAQHEHRAQDHVGPYAAVDGVSRRSRKAG